MPYRVAPRDDDAVRVAGEIDALGGAMLRARRTRRVLTRLTCVVACAALACFVVSMTHEAIVDYEIPRGERSCGFGIGWCGTGEVCRHERFGPLFGGVCACSCAREGFDAVCPTYMTCAADRSGELSCAVMPRIAR